MCTASDVAKYFLIKSDPDSGDTISNLKLQKLLYLAQGFFLAIYGEPLFSAKIEAWTHGPVVPEIYHKYKKYEGSAIPIPKLEFSLISKKARQLLDEIWSVYGQFSAWKLRDITHDHTPWKKTVQGDIISTKKMESYFKTLVKTA
jgi:uncharacterized phage-associated protein